MDEKKHSNLMFLISDDLRDSVFVSSRYLAISKQNIKVNYTPITKEKIEKLVELIKKEVGHD